MSDQQKQILSSFEFGLRRRLEDVVLEVGIENAPAVRSGALRALRAVKEAVDLLWEYYEVPGGDDDDDGDGDGNDNSGGVN